MLLPSPPWFREKLIAVGGQELAGKIKWNRTKAAFLPHIVALSWLSTAEQEYQGCNLTPWNQELELQRQHYRYPDDGFGLRCLDVIPCTAPIQMLHRKCLQGEGGCDRVRLSMRKGFLFQPHWPDELGLLMQACLYDGSQARTIAEVLGARGLDMDIRDIPCLIIPEAIFCLLERRRWHHLLCLGRWVRKLQVQGFANPFGWPPQGWIDARHGGHGCFQPHPAACNSEQCMEVAMHMKKLCLNAIHNEEEDEERESKKMMWHDMVGLLEGWALHQGMLRGDVSSVRQPLAAFELMSCVRLARKLRGGGKELVDIIGRSLQASGLDLDDFGGPLSKLPKKSALQRHELTLDVSLMLLEARRAAVGEPIVRWAWSDSSPQENHDWLWEQCIEMAQADLIPCFDSVLRIAQDVVHMSVDQLEESIFDVPQAWVPHLRCIKSSLRLHVSPPAAVSHGHRGWLTRQRRRCTAGTWKR